MGLLKNGMSPVIMSLVMVPWLWYTVALGIVSIVCLDSVTTSKLMISGSRFCFRMDVLS